MANDVERFIHHFGEVPKDLKREIRPELRAAGEIVAADVRRRTSWSKRIPPATRVSVSFAKRRPGVSIVVDKNKAPNARPLNHGGMPGEVRHPVFGNRKVWVGMPARPFLEPALEARGDEAARLIEHAVDRVIRKDF